MYEHLPELHRKIVFSKEDVSHITGSKERAATLLLNYQSRGLIAKVRRNLYCVLNLASSAPETSKAQIACAISPTATLAYHAAMEHHGFAHQPFYEMTVVSDTRFTPFEFDGIRYTFVHNPFSQGIQTVGYDQTIRITDLERTIIDCIDRIDLCGGIEELLHCLSSIHYVTTENLLHYLNSYHKIVLYKKTGYILSLFAENMHLPEDFFAVCRSHSNQSVAQLTTLEPCTQYISDWRLYVPQNINDYL